MDQTPRRRFLQQAMAGSAWAVAAQRGRARTVEKPKRPNLVLVFPDQMRGSAMGFLKEEPVITPNLDRFAAESLVLPEAASNYPVCSPFRAMLMTGQWPHRNKVISNCNSNSAPHGVELQEASRCWSDVLSDEGYALGYIGKWHMDAPYKPYVKSYNNRPSYAWNEWCPPKRRHSFQYWHAYGTFDQHMSPEYWTTDMKRDDRLKVDQWGPEHEADLAVQYIRNESGKLRDPAKPFALVVSMNPPHMPYGAFPKKYLEPYRDVSDEKLFARPNVPPADERFGKSYRRNIRNYYAMITGVDEQFGRILAAIEQAGVKDDTVVLFTSDHGDCLGIHNQTSKNNPYEESMRIPFLLRYPKRIRPRRDDLLISTPDIHPTLLDLMGLGGSIDKSVQGVSHAKLFATGEGKRPASQMYLKIPYADADTGWRGVRTHRYTLAIEKAPDKPDKTMLFDRKDDPWQMKNLAADKGDLVRKLLAEHLVPWLTQTGDPWLKHLKN